MARTQLPPHPRIMLSICANGSAGKPIASTGISIRSAGSCVAPLVGFERERELEPEGAAETDRALEPHAATHELDELLGDRRAEAGAAEPPGLGLVGLGEALEDPPLVLGRDADAGVADRELQRHRLRSAVHARDVERHAAPLGELDGVRQQIDEDLAQVRFVAARDRRHVRHDHRDETQLLRLGLRAEHLHHAVDERVEIEALLGDRELAGLDLREVEDVLDQSEHRARRRADRLHHPRLFAAQRTVAQQLDHADDRVQRRSHLVRHRRHELALGEVRGLRTVDRVVQALDQRQHVHRERHHPEQQTSADAQVRLPERAGVEHGREPDAAERERVQQVGLAVAEPVADDDPQIDHEQRQAVDARPHHEVAGGGAVDHGAEHPPHR